MEQEKSATVSLPAEAGLPASLTASAQTMVFAGLSSVSFVVPFLLGHPQWVVGAVVNACLFLAAAYLPKKYILPAVIFPSLGVMARGLVFGPFTPFLLYFLPFIWLGNLILILVFQKLYKPYKTDKPDRADRHRKSISGDTDRHRKSISGDVSALVAVFSGGAGKALFLFGFAYAYFKLSVVPALFLQAMGFNQLVTALIGGAMAMAIIKIFDCHRIDKV